MMGDLLNKILIQQRKQLLLLKAINYGLDVKKYQKWLGIKLEQPI